MTDDETPQLAVLADGPFATGALDFFDKGLCPMPCGGEDGKRPLIRWANWKKRPARARFIDLIKRQAMATANIGILTGLSGITIVDCDDEDLVNSAVEIFGATPLITATPSGGHHLWYRANGERCSNLRRHGFAIDVKGIGGFSVEPPSIRPSGKFAGVPYRFVTGGLNDVDQLPHVAYEAALRFDLRRGPASSCGTQTLPPKEGGIPEGQRNIALFRTALRLAYSMDDDTQLTEQLLAINVQECSSPLPENEVRRTAASAWRMHADGRNFHGRGGLTVTFDAIDAAAGPDAFFLLVKLRRYHAIRDEPFAIVPQAMAASGKFPGMSVSAIRLAREALVASQHLILVHRGGRGPRDPSLYRLGTDLRRSLEN